MKYRKNVNVCAPLYAGLMKNVARPEGQGLNLCLFLVKTHFVVVDGWGGGDLGEPGIFSAQRFCLYAQRTLKSHQPTATKHTGLHCEGP